MASTPAALADRIGASWADFLTADRHPATPHPYVYASAWRVCDRRMVYDCTCPQDAPPWSAEMLAKFRRGDDRERDLLADLARIGRNADPPFAVIGQQERFILKDHQGRPAIVGKVDARIEVDGVRPPVEIKTWAPSLVDRIDTFADVLDNPWTQSGAYQLLSYLYGAAEPFGFLLLDRSGIPRLLPVELDRHLDEVEAFLQKAERVVDHVEAGTMPAYLDDAAECQRCPWYGSTCNPPIAGTAATVLIDPDLEAALERREAIKATGIEYGALDADIKRRLRGVESGVIGHFAITGRWGKSSRVELPADLKRQYTVTDPRGRFTLEVTRL